MPVIDNADMSAGVHVLRWDGVNDNGRSIAPGPMSTCWTTRTRARPTHPQTTGAGEAVGEGTACRQRHLLFDTQGLASIVGRGEAKDQPLASGDVA